VWVRARVRVRVMPNLHAHNSVAKLASELVLLATCVRGMQQQCSVKADQLEKPPNSMPRMNSSLAHSLTVDGMESGEEAPCTGVITIFAKVPMEMIAAARLEQSTTTIVQWTRKRSVYSLMLRSTSRRWRCTGRASSATLKADGGLYTSPLAAASARRRFRLRTFRYQPKRKARMGRPAPR